MRSVRIGVAGLTAFLFLLLLTPIVAQEAENENTEETESQNSVIPLPWIIANSDLGFGPLGLVIITRDEPGVAPFKYQALLLAARTDRGFEQYAGQLDVVDFFDTGLRFSITASVEHNLLDNYFGYGNFHDLEKEENVASGRLPTGANIPKRPDLIQFEDWSANRDFIEKPNDPDSLNPGRHALRESQNRHYFFESARRSGALEIKQNLGRSNWQWRLGTELNRYRIFSYAGDREAGEFFPNETTLIDIDRPTGYDATEDARFVNTVIGGLQYDSRPAEREVHPDEGLLTGFKWEAAGSGTGSDYSFHRVSLYYHQYFSLFDRFFQARDQELIFALRASGTQVFGDMPFYYEDGLGGRELRGYPSRQFIDRVAIMAGGEIRFRVARFGDTDLILMGFAENGRVAPRPDDITTRGWHRAAGAGFNVLIDGNTLIELVVGASRHRNYFELSLGHTFLIE